MTSMQALMLFLISLKSPLYSSVIGSGISPLLILSTYSAVTFRGPITASNVSLKLAGISLKSIPVASTSALESSLPLMASSATFLKLETTKAIPFPMVRTMKKAINIPSTTATSNPMIMIQDAVFSRATESLAILVVAPMPAATVVLQALITPLAARPRLAPRSCMVRKFFR